MEVSGITQRTWICLFYKGILCKYGRKRRKKSVCQRTVDRFQQRRDQPIVQSGCAKRWIKVQEATKGNRAPEVDLLIAGKGE